MHRAADDNNLMRSVLFESDGYFISFIFLDTDKWNQGFDLISTYSLQFQFKLCDKFSYRFHLAGNTGHGEDIVNDKEKKLHRVLFLKHMQSMELWAQN